MVTSSFGKAFAAARKAGKKEFTWNGKSYNTKLKEEVGVSKSAPPKARPSAKKSPNRPTAPGGTPTASTSQPTVREMKAGSGRKTMRDRIKAKRTAMGIKNL